MLANLDHGHENDLEDYGIFTLSLGIALMSTSYLSGLTNYGKIFYSFYPSSPILLCYTNLFTNLDFALILSNLTIKAILIF